MRVEQWQPVRWGRPSAGIRRSRMRRGHTSSSREGKPARPVVRLELSGDDWDRLQFGVPVLASPYEAEAIERVIRAQESPLVTLSRKSLLFRSGASRSSRIRADSQVWQV